MKHRVEPIGALFAQKDMERLAKLLDQRSAEGYELHDVFQVQQPAGCLGIGTPTTTNLAVFRKAE